MQRDVTGVAPLVRSRASMSKLCRSVRGGRLGSVGANCPRLGLLWEAVHPIRRHYTPSDRVHRDGSGVSRRNGCSASRADLVLQAWSASVTDSGSGRGAAWTPPMLTAPAREPEPRASPAQQGCAEGQQTIGEGPSRVARALPLLCDRRDHRVGAVTTGVCISCAARSVTGQLRINLECRQRAVRAMTGWRCINPSVSKAAC